MKTYPLPGTTKFQSHLTDAQASFVAHEHYDVVSVVKVSDSSGHYHAVRTLGGYAAMIGIIDGVPMILHKRPDGSRELEPAALP